MFGKMHTDLFTVVTFEDSVVRSFYFYNIFCLARRLFSFLSFFTISKSYFYKNNKISFILFKVKVMIVLLLERLDNLVIRDSTFSSGYKDKWGPWSWSKFMALRLENYTWPCLPWVLFLSWYIISQFNSLNSLESFLFVFLPSDSINKVYWLYKIWKIWERTQRSREINGPHPIT